MADSGARRGDTPTQATWTPELPPGGLAPVDLLEPSMDHVRLALEASGTGLWTWDLRTQAVSWSAQCFRIHGLGGDEKPEHAADFFLLVHPQDRERVERTVRAAIEDRSPYECEFRVVRPGGETVWVENRGRASYGPDGQPRVMMGTVVDISLRKRAAAAEEELALLQRGSAAEDAERVQLALDAGAIVGTWVWHVPGNHFAADELFARSFGLDPRVCREGLPLEQVMESIHAEDLPRVRDAIAEAMARGGPYRCEYRVRREDGLYHWIEANGRVELGADGAPLRFPGVLLDIGERRRAEAERDQANALLRTFIEAVPGVVYAKDRDGRMLVANRGVLDLVGKPAERIIGRTDAEFLDDREQAQVVMANDRQIMESGIPQKLLEEVRLPDGSPAWWLSSKAPLRAADGTVIGLIGASIDVTDRVRTEQTLRERERELQTLADNLPDIIARFDRELRHVFVNAAVERATGIPREHFLGRTNRELGMPAQLCDLWDAALRGAFERSERGTVEFAYDTPAGRRHFLSRFLPEAGPDGQVRNLLSIVSDVTLQKEGEQALRLESQRKDEFLATLAHELRNPLAPIRNSVQLLRRVGPASPHAGKAVDILDRQVGHMVRLVDDLLDVARIGQGKVDLQVATVSLQSAVDAALETSRPLVEAAGHALRVDLPAQPLLVKGDPVRLAQVFANLLNNAAKYTPRGGRIAVTAERAGDRALLRVADTGNGIPAHMLATVFDLFVQVRDHADQAQGGLGIGLSLVRRLVEMHGGTVEVHSAGPGAGSTFTVSLPLAGAA